MTHPLGYTHSIWTGPKRRNLARERAMRRWFAARRAARGLVDRQGAAAALRLPHSRLATR